MNIYHSHPTSTVQPTSIHFNQIYKSRIGYCTVFSLQRDVPDLRIGISGSYRFKFQKKNIKVQKFEILFKFAYTERYLTENTGTALVFGGTDWYRSIFDRYNIGYQHVPFLLVRYGTAGASRYDTVFITMVCIPIYCYVWWFWIWDGRIK